MPRVKTVLLILYLVVRGAVGGVIGALAELTRRAGSTLTFLAVLLTVSAVTRLDSLWSKARSLR